MKWNRSWPGVPNRYSHRSPGSAIRPKSMATVVEVLRSVTPPASSTPTLCSVIAASVESGSMSEMAPMKVVLPTAKPPATTIFTVTGATGATGAASPNGACGACCAEGAATSERGNAIENTLQDLELARSGCLRLRGPRMDDHQPVVGQVADEDAHYPEGQRQMSRELGDGQDLCAGELEDSAVLRRATGPTGRRDAAYECLEREIDPPGSGAAAGECVRTHGPRLLHELVIEFVEDVIHPPVVVLHRGSPLHTDGPRDATDRQP